MKNSQEPAKLIFIVAAYNEERRISETIRSIRDFASQIIIIDSGSSDRTNSIARQLFPITICRTSLDMLDVVGRLNAAIQCIDNQIINPWIFPMNCGERFTASLGYRLLAIINQKTDVCGIRVYRQSYTLNTQTHSRKLYYVVSSVLNMNNNYRPLRLHSWDKDKSSIHREFPLIPSHRSMWLYPSIKASLLHYREGNLLTFEKKHSDYSEFEAKQHFTNNRRPSLLRLLLVPIATLIYFSPSLLRSRTAFIVGVYHAFYKFQVEAKLFMLFSDALPSSDISKPQQLDIKKVPKKDI